TNGAARGPSLARGIAHGHHPARSRGPELRGDRHAHGLPDRHGPLAHLPRPRGDRRGTQAADGHRNRADARGAMSRNMTQDNDDIDIDLQPPADKLYAHNRRQLSAMLDGELSPDQARFMLRRLQHDTELAACWERWQVCGDVLRGRGHALLPADFSRRVADAIGAPAGESGAAGVAAAARVQRREHRLLRWGGGALAASVALVALFMARQLPDHPGPDI